MNVRLSKTLAIVFGIGLPILGIVRNWTLANGDASGFFVDLAAGGFLLFGVWKVTEKERTGQRYLAAAWGFTIGLFYASLDEQISNLWKEQIVAAPIPAEWVILATVLAMCVAIIGLVASLRSTKNK